MGWLRVFTVFPWFRDKNRSHESSLGDGCVVAYLIVSSAITMKIVAVKGCFNKSQINAAQTTRTINPGLRSRNFMIMLSSRLPVLLPLWHDLES